MGIRRMFVTFWLAALFALPAFGAPIPDCVDAGRVLTVDNAQAIAWKLDPTVRSGFKDQLYVQGRVTQIFPDRTGHEHFVIQIGPNTDDVIEVVYSNAFGQMPDPVVGEEVSACGEYIKSTQANGGYPPSPAGAIIHWVHQNPRFSPGNGSHDHGFVVMRGELYGWDLSNAARPPRH
jgi:hypothetical protein